MALLILDGAGLYELVDDKTSDTVYVQNDPEVTTENMKPDTTVDMFLIGDE